MMFLKKKHHNNIIKQTNMQNHFGIRGRAGVRLGANNAVNYAGQQAGRMKTGAEAARRRTRATDRRKCKKCTRAFRTLLAPILDRNKA